MKRIAIAGATGAVGGELIKLLEHRNFPVQELRLLASARSVGKKLRFAGKEIEVKELTPHSFAGIDIAFFSAGASRSKEFAPHAVEAGALVIDNSSAFRMDEDIPLVVPEVNSQVAFTHQGIIANPNCSTIQMVVVLNPIHQVSPVKRLITSTYQAASGAGAAAMQELNDQIKAYANNQPMKVEQFSRQIALNLIPHIDVFQENGYTKEEMKMVYETQKIMSAPQMKISCTCVRVPVLRSHSEAIWIETERKITETEAREILSHAAGVVVQDQREKGIYPVPWEVSETYETYVGRIREDLSCDHGLTFWVVADQLYKGAALNAIQIAELFS